MIDTDVKKIIIGSEAIRHHFPDFHREPKDLDYAVSDKYKPVHSVKGIEYLENPILFKYCDDDYLSPDMLLTLKVSHLFWDINWDKHMYDVQFLIKKGCVIIPEMLNELIEYWNEYHPKIRRSDLGMDKESFFTNAVNESVNEHDYLHTLINPVPMYTKLLKDGCEVELDENKFHNLNFQEKCDVVFEEAAVMSYERYKNEYYRIGYHKQLKDNIIKHYPRYISLFAIENYIELLKPKFNFIKKIEDGLQIIK